jgi:hypothetical protein
MELIKKRGNQSAPGFDGITFPFLKLEKEAAALLIISMMRLIISVGKIPKIWKMGKTILIHKTGDPNDPGNWRPITLTSVVYRIIFGRISQCLMQFENSTIKRGLLNMSQKGFIPRINGCGEHISLANMAINRAMTEHRILYILALDMRDAFGSVSHMQLKNNLSSLGLHKRLSNVIMDSYNEAKVKIVTLNGMTNDINIARGVKQGCPLSRVLFDICIDPLIEKLSWAQYKKNGFYWGFQKEDGVTAQAYADDILLFSSSYQGLTNLFNVVQDFIYESNIHLNTKKCEILRIGNDGQASF